MGGAPSAVVRHARPAIAPPALIPVFPQSSRATDLDKLETPPPKTTDRRELAAVAVTKDRLTSTLGQRILSLATRKRSGIKLDVRPLAECAHDMIVLDTGGRYKLQPVCTALPACSGSNDRPVWDRAFRDTEKAQSSGVWPDAIIDPPKVSVGRILGARVDTGIVTTADGRTVAESLAVLPRDGAFARDADGAYYQRKKRFSQQRRIRSRTAVLLTATMGGDYRRWLTEELPRIALIEEHFDLRHLIFIIAAGAEPMRATYEDALALFGIRADQIIDAGAETLVVDDLLYPAPLNCFPFALSPRCVAILEQLATRVRANPFGHQRLYVTGGAGTKKPMADETGIVALAERHGFATIEPEALSFYQQIGLFRQARIIIGRSHAGIANAVFSTQDLTLVALNPSSADDDLFSHLMSLKDGRYISLRGTADNDLDAASIDVAGFARLLTEITGGTPLVS